MLASLPFWFSSCTISRSIKKGKICKTKKEPNLTSRHVKLFDLIKCLCHFFFSGNVNFKRREQVLYVLELLNALRVLEHVNIAARRHLFALLYPVGEVLLLFPMRVRQL